jgi:hypothetical protein
MFEEIIEYLPYIFSTIAIGLSVSSFYYSYLRGPKLKAEHLSFEEKNNNYLHTITLINNGNKTGILRSMVVKSDNMNVKLNQDHLRISKGEEWVSNDAVIPIQPKESIVIRFSYFINYPKQSHKIEITHDKAGIRGVKPITYTLWEKIHKKSDNNIVVRM